MLWLAEDMANGEDITLFFLTHWRYNILVITEAIWHALTTSKLPCGRFIVFHYIVSYGYP